MPRKRWIPKNPYCCRSKIDKKEFEDLVYYYFYEVTFSHSRQHTCTLLMHTFNMDTGKRHTSLTRQAISRYFNKLGGYIWDRWVVNNYPTLQGKEDLDELFNLISGKIDKINSHKDVYNSFDDWPFYVNSDTINDSLMFYLLSNRSKVARGISQKDFYLEFSRVFFVCATIKSCDIEVQSIYSTAKYVYSRTEGVYYMTDRKKIDHISDCAVSLLLRFLREKPM